MGYLSNCARVRSWLGIVAVLSNVLASLQCIAPARAVVAIDEIPEPIVLCTEHGPQLLPGSDPAGGSGNDQRDSKSSHCTACTLLSGPALVVAFLFAPIAFPAAVFRPFHSCVRTLADHLGRGGIRVRGPPLSA